MNELIATFHIDWKLLVAQAVNFLIVAVVLWRFALKPLTAVLRERNATIEKSLADAAAIEQRLKETSADIQERVREAKLQATAIIETAKREAEGKRQELLATAKTDVEKIITAARAQIGQEKEAALAGARAELASLVALGVTKVLGREVNDSRDHKLVADRVKKLR